MKYAALILGLTLPVTLLSCTRAETQTAKQNVELDSLEEKVAALEAQLGTNLKYEKDDYGSERWYDSNGNLIHDKSSGGYEEWYEYDSNGHLIHNKDSNGDEEWYEYENVTVTDSDYRYDMFVYDSRGNLIHEKNLYGDETWYEYDSTGNLVHTTDNLSGNGCCQEKIDYWSNGHIKTSLSSDKHGIQHYQLFNKEGKVSLTESFEDHWIGADGRYCYVEYKNSHPFRIWDVCTRYLYTQDILEEPEPPLYSEAFEIHYDKSGKITTVKTWCQEKDINDSIINADNYWDLLCGLGGPERCWDGSVISLEKNLEISEDNTITFKQWPPDMGGDVIHEKLLPKTDWENYFDKNGNFTADGLSWIHEYENYEYLRPQKNKH
ncbi:MAG: hypothetical protein IKQ66_04630 [Treponema sp.]|nr:hypothetical protein [Treponema sp.]